MKPSNILLMGTVGSHAYGLNTPESDVDTLGVFAEPAENFWKLVDPEESYVEKDPDPDLTLHEARKYARLAINCNPTALELMWIPDELLQVCTPCGRHLQEIRSSFLTADRVRGAYLGYAGEQFKRLSSRQDGTFSSDTRNRTAKHARHMLRLLIQGVELHQEGTLTLRLEDPENVRAFGDAIADGDLLLAETALEWAKTLFETKSVLSDTPDTNLIENWLRSVRRAYL